MTAPASVPPRLRPLLPWLLLTALVCGSYANALGNGFAYDDKRAILGNEAVRSLRSVPDLFFMKFHARSRAASEASYTGSYRPIAALSVAVDFALWGAAAPGHHATSVLLHLLVTLAAFALFRRLVPADAAFVGAALFAVHPVHTEAVTALSNRGDVLATLFVLASLAALRLVLDAPATAGAGAGAGGVLGWRAGAYLSTCFLFLCGLLSKETAFMLPGFVLLLLCLVRDRWTPLAAATAGARVDRAWLRRAGIACAGLAVPVAVALALRIRVDQGFRPPPSIFDMAGTPTLVRAALLVQVFADYVRLAVLGWPLAANYPWNSPWGDLASHVSGFRLPVSVLTLGLLVTLTLVFLRKVPLLAFGVGWFFVALFPVSHLAVKVGIVQSDRSLYLPTVGSCLLLGAAACALRQRASFRLRPLVTLCIVAWLVAFSLLTFLRNPDWRDDEAVARSIVRDRPDAPQGHDFLGGLLLKAQNWPEAEQCYRRLGSFSGAEGAAWQGIGMARLGRRRFAEAVEALEQSLRHQDAADTHGRLAFACLALGKQDLAERHYVRAYELDPRSAERTRELGLFRLRTGHEEEAVRLLLAAMRLETGEETPDEFTWNRSIGIDALRIERPDLALPFLDRACSVRPDEPEPRLERGIARYLADPVADRALADFEHCLRNRPGWPDALRWRGIALRRLGRLDDAAKDLREAVRANRQDREAGRHLFLVLAALGLRGDALQALADFPELRASVVPEVVDALRSLGVRREGGN
ncbi:MAG: tetratricopeptide repeat protein [Planctomycetes bacterium]|nr:tetratricopeptide repeat protein [Planctomycetota bacterium]